MNSIKILTVFLLLLLFSSLSFGQDSTEHENWLKGLGTEADVFSDLYYQYKTFTKDDVNGGKLRLNNIRKFAPKNEWEGIYYTNVEIGDSKMIWNSEGGFLNLFFYHELKSFNYGRIYDAPSFVELISEKTSNKNRGQSFKTKLIKITIEGKHFLVPENRLQDFCDRAAGLETEYDFNYYYIKEADMNQETSGLPVLPSKYIRFLRFPIRTEIVKVDQRKTVPSGSYPPSDEVRYVVTLNVGKNKEVKRQMNFFVESLDEWIEITNVFQSSSRGFIRRDFDANKQEQCRNERGGSGESVPCKEIKNGMQASTKANL